MVSWEEKQFAIIEMNYLFIYRIYFNECTTLTNWRILHLLEQDFYLQHTQYDKGSSKWLSSYTYQTFKCDRKFLNLVLFISSNKELEGNYTDF